MKLSELKVTFLLPNCNFNFNDLLNDCYWLVIFFTIHSRESDNALSVIIETLMQWDLKQSYNLYFCLIDKM